MALKWVVTYQTSSGESWAVNNDGQWDTEVELVAVANALGAVILVTNAMMSSSRIGFAHLS